MASDRIKSTRLFIRITEAEKLALKQLAKEKRTTLSNTVRRAALNELYQNQLND
jgi:hypothetical protein